MDSRKPPSEAKTPAQRAQASSAPVNAGKGTRKRLKKAGVAILEEYARQHPDDVQPTPITQRSLLEQVQQAQGDDGVGLRSIMNWFKSRRLKIQPSQRRGGLSSPQTPISPVTPFTEETLRTLYTLVQATPDPGPEVFSIWASLFKVTPPVLQYVLQVILPLHFPPDTQGSASSTSPHPQTNPPYSGSHSQRLPTPPDSSTPEPASCLPADQHLHHRGVPASDPVNTHVSHSSATSQNQQNERPAYSHRPVPESAPIVDEYPRYELSPPWTPKLKSKPSLVLAVPEYRVRLLKHAILQGIADACIGNSTSTPRLTSETGPDASATPKTATEFHDLFQPYVQKLQALSRTLSTMPSPDGVVGSCAR